MEVIDTYKNMNTCYINGVFQKKQWDIYISEVDGLKQLIEDDVTEYDFEQDILPVMNGVMQNKTSLDKMYYSFLNVIDGIKKKVITQLKVDLDVTIVLYLGLCNGAGWATKLNGKPVVLLGIEKIIELGWIDEQAMIGLIYHELGHIWHFQERTVLTEIKTQQDQSLWKLYTEGMAMYCEQLLCEKADFYHQNKNGWLLWCQKNRKKLFQEYLRRIKEEESTQDFFGDWCSFEGHSDIGYYLGTELVKTALIKYKLQQLLNLSIIEVKDILYTCIQESSVDDVKSR